MHVHPWYTFEGQDRDLELFQGNKWRVYPETGEGRKILRKRKKPQCSCKMIFAWFNPVCKISKLNKFKMELNSRDIWKSKLASCSKEMLFLFCQSDSSEIHVTDPLR